LHAKADYAAWHDLARHSIHSVETLDVAVDTVTELLEHHKVFLESSEGSWAGASPGGWSTIGGGSTLASMMVKARATRRLLQFQAQVLRHLRARAASNEKRIHNEISFVRFSFLDFLAIILVAVRHRGPTSFPFRLLHSWAYFGSSCFPWSHVSFFSMLVPAR
jgi:hypothetical protein